MGGNSADVNGNFWSTIMDRIRNQRRQEGGVEAALGNYLRTALRERWGDDSSPLQTGDAIPATSGTVISDEFQAFLQGIQTDVNGALHAFAAPPGAQGEAQGEAAEEEQAEGGASAPGADGAPSLAEPIASNTPANASTPSVATAEAETAQTSLNNSLASTPAAVPEDEAIPSFHYQRGQNRPNDPQRRFGLTGGTDGAPRQLNLFRAYMFPPVNQGQGEPTPTGTDDPNGVVPCIFVGVRSMPRNTPMNDDEDGDPPREFGSGAGSGTGPESPDTTETAEPPLSPTASGTARRTFRERVLERLYPRRAEAAQNQVVMTTFAVFVIGGYYPRSHPVLSIPSLLSGGPLTDEEIVLVSELMGRGKPITATKEDIEKSGLAVVDGSQIGELVSTGDVLENCLERCLVSLSCERQGAADVRFAWTTMSRARVAACSNAATHITRTV